MPSTCCQRILKPYVMIFYQYFHNTNGLVVELEPFQDLFAKFGPSLVMAFKMVNALVVCSFAIRFPDVMKKHGKANDRIVGGYADGLEGMVAHTVVMVGIVLGDIHHPVKLREEYGSQFCFPGQSQSFRMV